MDKDNIIKKFPSKCWDCKNRRAVCDELLTEGYCGCVLGIGNDTVFDTDQEFDNKQLDIISPIKCSEMSSGWIYPKRYPFKDYSNISFSGVMCNLQLQLKEVTNCPWYIKDKDN